MNVPLLMGGIVAVLVITPAKGQELDIKGIKLGMTMDQVATLHVDFRCPPIELCMIPGKHAVASMRTFADSSVEKWVLDFRDGGKLGAISVYLDSAVATKAMQALTEKFGKAEKTDETEFKTQGGLRAKQVTMTWGRPEAFLQVKSPYGNIREMVVRLSSTSFLESRNKSAVGKAKSDL